jgi:hypothetical protein
MSDLKHKVLYEEEEDRIDVRIRRGGNEEERNTKCDLKISITSY